MRHHRARITIAIVIAPLATGVLAGCSTPRAGTAASGRDVAASPVTVPTNAARYAISVSSFDMVAPERSQAP